MTDPDIRVRTYRLSCTTCSFAATVEGDLDAVMERVEAHTASADGDASHFVEFEIVEW